MFVERAGRSLPTPEELILPRQRPRLKTSLCCTVTVSDRENRTFYRLDLGLYRAEIFWT